MAIIQDISEIERLIPTYRDLGREGNFASVEDGILKCRPLYAFTINGVNLTTVKSDKIVFCFLALTKVYALIVANSRKEINRYSDFKVIQRDITKPLRADSWEWENSAVGLRMVSSAIGSNVIYFGTDEKDVETIRKAIKDGKVEFPSRVGANDEKKLEMRGLVLDVLRNGKTKNVNITEKTKADAEARRPDDALKNYRRIRFGDIDSPNNIKEEITVVTDTVYV